MHISENFLRVLTNDGPTLDQLAADVNAVLRGKGRSA